MRFSIACPHCRSRSIARAMEKLSDTAWLIDFQCDNVRCGHACRTRIDLIPPVVPIPKLGRRQSLPLFANVDLGDEAVFVSGRETRQHEKGE